VTRSDRSSLDATGADDREDAGESSEDAGEGAGYLVERGIAAASVVVVVALLGYLLWQAAVTPEAARPVATVESVEPATAGGDGDGTLRASVVLANRGSVGLTSVEVTVHCGTRERTLQFERVPAQGQRTGVATCPAGTDPRAAVTTWVEAGD